MLTGLHLARHPSRCAEFGCLGFRLELWEDGRLTKPDALKWPGSQTPQPSLNGFSGFLHELPASASQPNFNPETQRLH